jgi:hypothetical protein
MRIAVFMLVLLASASAAADSASPLPPKANSLAPRGHGGARSYGAPIGPRILSHVRKKPAAKSPAAPNRR